MRLDKESNTKKKSPLRFRMEPNLLKSIFCNDDDSVSLRDSGPLVEFNPPLKLISDLGCEKYAYWNRPAIFSPYAD